MTFVVLWNNTPFVFPDQYDICAFLNNHLDNVTSKRETWIAVSVSKIQIFHIAGYQIPFQVYECDETSHKSTNVTHRFMFQTMDYGKKHKLKVYDDVWYDVLISSSHSLSPDQLEIIKSVAEGCGEWDSDSVSHILQDEFPHYSLQVDSCSITIDDGGVYTYLIHCDTSQS